MADDRDAGDGVVADPAHQEAARIGGEERGGIVEAGRTVTCLIGAANRDERRFDRPEVFDVLRPDLDHARAFSAAADHLAFCLGRHFCVGALLSLFEIEVGMNDLLDAMGDIRFADGAPPAETGVFTRAPDRLLLEFTPS